MILSTNKFGGEVIRGIVIANLDMESIPNTVQ